MKAVRCFSLWLIVVMLVLSGCKSGVFWEKSFFYPVNAANAEANWELKGIVRFETRGGNFGKTDKKRWFVGFYDKSLTELASANGDIEIANPEVQYEWTIRNRPKVIVRDSKNGNVVVMELQLALPVSK